MNPKVEMRADVSRSACLIAALALTFAMPAPAAGATGGVDNSADVAFRSGLHFRSDSGYIDALRERPGTMWYGGTPFSPDEFAELQQRIDLEDDARTISDVLSQDAHVEGFGGLYIDHASGGRLVIMLVSPETDTIPRAMLRQPSRIEVRQARFSLRQLSAWLDAVTQAVKTGDPAMVGIESAAVDLKANTIRVALNRDTLSEHDGPPPEFVRRFPESSYWLFVARSESGNLSGLASDPNAPPIVGGHGFGPINNSTCTAGFKVWKGDDTAAYMLTAGHCVYGLSGATRYHRDVPIGTVNAWAVGGAYDFGLVRLSSNTKMRAEVWYDKTLKDPGPMPVVGTATAYTIGAVRCFTGKSTNRTKCGNITYDNWSGWETWPGHDDIYMTNVIVVSTGCKGGDSGSPVVKYDSTSQTVKAAGILYGCTPDGSSFHFHRWIDIPPGWQLEVVT